jgi:hypothetical protein
MFMDTTGFLATNGGKEPDLTTEDGKMTYSKFVNEFFAYVPQKYLYNVNGAELVWMYGDTFIKKIDDTTFDYAKQKYAEQFGASRKLTFLGMGFLDTAKKSQISSYSWGVSLFGATVCTYGIPIGCIGPGFYALGAYRDGCQFNLGIRTRDRQGGQYYIDSFRQVMKQSQWVVIEVWNEYHEGNDISYSLEYKDMYINLTRQLIEEFKTSPFISYRGTDTLLSGTGIISAVFVVLMIKRKNLSLVTQK